MRHVLALAALVAISLGGPLARPATAVTYIYLSVSLFGNGSGAWQSADGQIDCRMVNGYVDPREPCAGQYEAGPNGSATVTYSIIPAAGSCVKISLECPADGGAIVGATTTFTGDVSKFATFNLLKYDVVVSRAGTGSGQVSSSPGGIICAPSCEAAYNYGTALTLTAVAAQGSYFDHWNDDCAGQGATCNLTVTGYTETTATFTFGSPSTASPPAPTPTATAGAGATPKATVKPAATTRPSPPPVATPGSSPQGATPPVASAGSGETSDPTSGHGETPAPTEPPIVQAVASADLTPIALAILGAGLLIAVGIGAGAYLVRRRGPLPPP